MPCGDLFDSIGQTKTKVETQIGGTVIFPAREAEYGPMWALPSVERRPGSRSALGLGRKVL